MKSPLRLIAMIMAVILIGGINRRIKAVAQASATNTTATQSCQANATIWSIALSPDNQYVLASWNGGESRLWDIKTGKVVRIWPQNGDEVTSVGFSPDGKSAFTASRGGVVIWDVGTGDKLKVFNLTADNIDGVDAAFVENGKQILIVESVNARLWDIATGNMVHFFQGFVDHEHGESFQISPDGNYMLLNDYDNVPSKGQNLWNIQMGELIHTFEYPTEEDFAPDGKSLIVSATDDAQKDELYLFDIATNKRLKTFPISTGLGAMFISPNGKYFVAARANDVELWDVARAVQLHTFHFVPYLSYTGLSLWPLRPVEGFVKQR